MHKPAYYIINGITLYRAIAAPLLILLIIGDRPVLFRWLLAISFFTDAIDGYLARRYKVASIMGSKLDSIADDLTIAAAIVGIIVFRAEFIKHEFILISLLLTLYITQTMLALIRYGRISSFHTYAAKTAAVLQGIFIIFLFFLPLPVYYLFHIAAAVTCLELIEEIILVLLLPRWMANIKGLYWVIKNKQPGKP